MRLPADAVFGYGPFSGIVGGVFLLHFNEFMITENLNFLILSFTNPILLTYGNRLLLNKILGDRIRIRKCLFALFTQETITH